MRNLGPTTSTGDIQWAQLIPQADWDQYQRVLTTALERRIPFALGGGFAFSAYAHRWRNTKDIDLYILPQHLQDMITIVQEAGFVDFFDQLPYDRQWIYRATREGVICDLIWAMANQRSQTDQTWVARGPQVEIHGLPLRLLPPEELIWAKLYVLQRDRCDWPDLLNVLNVQAPSLDWQHLLERLGPDTPMLGGLLSVFKWLCPSRAARVPLWVWPRVGVHPPPRTAALGPAECDPQHVRFLDTRDWFGTKTF